MDRVTGEIFIYVEKFNRSLGYLLIDFVDSNEIDFFIQTSKKSYDWLKRPTMIEIVNYRQRNLQEGVCYRLSEKVILLLSERFTIVEDSLLIGFRVELNEEDPAIIGSSKSFGEVERTDLNIEEGDPRIPNLTLRHSNIDSVLIRSIGQGSWNEIYCDEDVVLVFDMGTIHSTKTADLMRLIGQRDIDYQRTKPILVVSHWDVDHYHFLLGVQDDTIRAFSYFIYRGLIPNLTVRKVLGRFRILNSACLVPVIPEDPYPRRSSKILRRSYLTPDRRILIFNSERNRSRNKCALGLGIRNISTTVLFTGDYDYSQVSNYMLPDFNYSADQYLVVPHHGGWAGRFIYNQGQNPKLAAAVVSVGRNPYGHPSSGNVTELNNKGFRVFRTDYHGDYRIKC